MSMNRTAYEPGETILSHFAAQYEEALAAFERGDMEAEQFRTTRIGHGVHSQRPPSVAFMVRVKLPYGTLSGNQMRALAEIASQTPEGLHITSRESVEFHGVALADTPAILHRLAAFGLTTKEAGGNSFRNVVACPMAGVCPFQPYDLRPYLRSFVRSEIGHPVIRMLPRKIKVAFSGCAKDCALVRLHDIGLVANEVDGRPGFRVYVGGGMGTHPMVAQPLAAFVPTESVSQFVLATAHVFDRLGERRNRERARMKFLIQEIGLERFRNEVRKAYAVEQRDDVAWWDETTPHPVTRDLASDAASSTWDLSPMPKGVPAAWVRTCVKRQYPAGLLTIFLSPRDGDLTSTEANRLADLADTYGSGELAVTQSQQILIRNVPEALLTAFYDDFTQHGPVDRSVQEGVRVVSCPGAETCNLGLTRSRDLGRNLRRRLAQRPEAVVEPTRDLQFGIRVNGCAHSCCHIRVAPLGLMGSTAKYHDRSVPMYTVLLGGGALNESVRWSTPVIRIPARMVPEAVERLLGAYQDERHTDESFSDWAARRFALREGQQSGSHAQQRALRLQLAQAFFHGLHASDERADEGLFQDWGSDTAFSWSVGRPECDNMPEHPSPPSPAHLSSSRTGDSTWEVTAEQVQIWRKNPSVRLIDVRSIDEYAHGHVAGAEWIPVERIGDAALSAVPFRPDETVVFICRTGHRSMDACIALRSNGHRGVFSLQGGILSWEGPWDTE